MITLHNDSHITPDEREALLFAAQSLLPNIGLPAHNFDPAARRKHLDIQDAIKIIGQEYHIQLQGTQ